MAKKDWPDWHIYLRDGCRCQYCGFSGIGNFNAFSQLVVDHRSKVVACGGCSVLLRNFPSRGRGRSGRDVLKAAKTHIARKYAERVGDFVRMMSELQRRKGR